MPKFRIDGLFLLVVVVLAALFWLSRKGEAVKQALQKVNPASDQNVAYEVVNEVYGEDTVAGVGDRIFGAIDLVNPWADENRKKYAKQVWGMR